MANINSTTIGETVYSFDFYKMCTKEYTESNFKKIKEYHQWLKSLLK